MNDIFVHTVYNETAWVTTVYKAHRCAQIGHVVRTYSIQSAMITHQNACKNAILASMMVG